MPSVELLVSETAARRRLRCPFEWSELVKAAAVVALSHTRTALHRTALATHSTLEYETAALDEFTESDHTHAPL